VELSVAEAAARLGVDDSRARQMLRDGLLPGRRGTVVCRARAANGRRPGRHHASGGATGAGWDPRTGRGDAPPPRGRL